MTQDATCRLLTSLAPETDADLAAKISAELARDADQVRAVFFDESVAALWQDDPRVAAVAWGPALARQVLAAVPPSPLDRVAPPPVIVGDGPMAGMLLRELVAGWSELGQPLTVHCVGWEERWAEEAAAWAGDAAEVSWLKTPLHPASVEGCVAELLAGWAPPPPNRGTATGPSVYVACADEATGAVLARAVAARISGARVALVGGDIRWPASAVVVCTRQQAVAHVLSGTADAAQDLSQWLFTELAWLNSPDAAATRHDEEIFPTGVLVEDLTAPDSPGGGSTGHHHNVEDPEGAPEASSAPGLPRRVAPWSSQPDGVREAYLRVARRVTALLAAGDVEVTAGVREPNAVLLTPAELGAVACELLATVARERSQGAWQAAVEVAARLPMLASRAGYTVRRPVGYQPILTGQLLDDLASQVHWTYQQAAAATSNATGSPLASALWEGLTPFFQASNRAVVTGSAVTHAVAGLTWERSREGLTPAPLSEEDVKYLGELEHRRWAIFVRRCGRPDHEWAKEWATLGEATQFYDIEIMRALPSILADGGITLGRLTTTMGSGTAPCPSPRSQHP